MSAADRSVGDFVQGVGLTGEVGVVNGDVAAASVVQFLQLGSVRLCNVGKVLLVVGVDLFRVGLARLVAKVVPLGCRQGKLRLLDVLGREELLQVVPLVYISTADVLDLSRTDDRLARFVAGLGWNVVSLLPGGTALLSFS